MITYREYCKRLNERKSKDCIIREDWGTMSPIPKEVYEFPKYTEKAHNKKELQDLIKKRIECDGVNADLNDIDVSQITDMSELFDSKFNGDISGWDVSNVTDMLGMFRDSPLENNPPAWYK